MITTTLTKQQIKQLASDKIQDKYFYIDENTAYIDGFIDGYKKGQEDYMIHLIHSVNAINESHKSLPVSEANHKILIDILKLLIG